MLFTFYKYQGTGNDFVIIDNRLDKFPKNDTKLVHHLCDRRFGVGADGLILLENHPTADFKMVYFNADGNESSMCGNGGRCIVAFANFLGIIEDKATFEAIDGMHYASISDKRVSLQMQNVDDVSQLNNYVFLDTGSPHHVQFENELQALDVKEKGAAIRYGKYGKSGSNINFVEKESDDIFAVRTYERGVEDETLSCGTGVTAVAIAMNHLGETNGNSILLKTQGGELNVSFDKDGGAYKNIFLEGPAVQVFKGEVEC
ncbi:diaminopimelate epimerase [Leptobacterium flavescens]|uniref:Diaminopimelate epimerase n=1 Tax=Leptobacterium flavescens TaxID=472055 RepID=A0A6P0UIZ9_9FLAO|nr:diaminopimelate epimerase [Leptobacterium flavescens]NER13285.1 diaminopimelate epimerase [Leptobacterium flavescens]